MSILILSDSISFLFFCFFCIFANYSAHALPRRTLLASASIPRHYNNRHRLSLRTPSCYVSEQSNAIWLASSENKRSRRRSRSSKEVNHSPTITETINEADGASNSAVGPPEVSYADLGPVGKIVAGSVEIAVSTLLEYASGFMGGYVIGTMTDIPRFLFRTASDPTQQVAVGWHREISKRYVRMHTKSLRWAQNWAGISAAFGGFRVATKVVRSGKEDEWNTIISSAAAGAYFARKEGPRGMIRGAVMYGGLMYLLSGGKLSGTNAPFQDSYEPIDF